MPEKGGILPVVIQRIYAGVECLHPDAPSNIGLDGF